MLSSQLGEIIGSEGHIVKHWLLMLESVCCSSVTSRLGFAGETENWALCVRVAR